MTLQREAYNRKPADELTECFEREGTVICGVVRSELLHGAVSDRDFANITIIATLAIKYDIPVWTGDRHFSLIQNVLTDLRLYQADS